MFSWSVLILDRRRGVTPVACKDMGCARHKGDASYGEGTLATCVCLNHSEQQHLHVYNIYGGAQNLGAHPETKPNISMSTKTCIHIPQLLHCLPRAECCDPGQAAGRAALDKGLGGPGLAWKLMLHA